MKMSERPKCPRSALFHTTHPIITHKKNFHLIKEIPPLSECLIGLYWDTSANGITQKGYKTHTEANIVQ